MCISLFNKDQCKMYRGDSGGGGGGSGWTVW